MISIIRHTLITALRDYLFIGLVATLLVAVFISCFLGSTAIVEQEQMTLSYMAGSTRLINVIGLILFVCFHVRRAFDNKEIEVTLTKPISKAKFVIAYWFAFALLAIIMSAILITIIASLNLIKIKALSIWSLSLLFESIMIIAFAMLSALIMRGAVTAALSSMCFYFVARMMGFFIATIDHLPHSFSFENLFHWCSESVLRAVSIILPRLDLFGKTSWLIYDSAGSQELILILTQSLVYIPLLLAVIIFDFKRKQF